MINDFHHKLIKGKIAEIIFGQMFQEMGSFTIIPFGYESTIPEIAQMSHLLEYKYVLDQVRLSPDFAIVSHDKKKVFLVEVKFFSIFNQEKIFEIAQKIHSKWKVVWLFIVTPEGFFFDSCTNIIRDKGRVQRLAKNWVEEELQKKYLLTLKDFIK